MNKCRFYNVILNYKSYTRDPLFEHFKSIVYNGIIWNRQNLNSIEDLYILHPRRVMLNCESEAAKVCAVLHDVIKDTNITLDDMKAKGFTEEIITILDLRI